MGQLEYKEALRCKLHPGPHQRRSLTRKPQSIVAMTERGKGLLHAEARHRGFCGWYRGLGYARLSCSWLHCTLGLFFGTGSQIFTLRSTSSWIKWISWGYEVESLSLIVLDLRYHDPKKVEPHGHSPWHPSSRPSGATSPDECRDAFIHGQSPWLSAAGVKDKDLTPFLPVK